MKRIITALLAVTMVFSVICLASCAEKQTTTDTNNDNVVSGDIYLDNIPEDVNFANADETERTVTFVYVEGKNGTYTARSIKVDDLTGDSVDTKIYERNKTIESRFGITIESIMQGDAINTLQSNISSVLQAGDPDYDVIAGYQFFDLNMATLGYVLDINTLDQYGANYIDIEADYWATDYIKNMHYGDPIYWLSGDLSLRFVGGQYCTFVNSRIYDSVLKEKYGSVYDIVKEGRWTLDLLGEMAALCYRDLNTNEKPDEADVLGMVVEVGQDMSDGIAIGAGVTWSVRNPDGSISVTLGGPRTMEFSSKYYQMINSGYFYNPASSDSVTQMTVFKNGNVAFTINKLYQSEVYLREMEDNFYIIPTPKFNQTQTEHYTGLHDGNTIFGITYCSDAIAASAVALEALAAESLRTVTPEFYEFALKFKYTRDDEASEMIDLIKECAYSDFVFVWGNSINKITHFFRTPNPNPTSAYKKQEGNVTKALAELLESLSGQL